MQEITTQFIKKFISAANIAFVGTQSKLCVPIIFRMCRKMAHGIRFDEIKVCDNMIIDGHHRYLSALIMNFEIGHVLGNATSATQSIDWNLVEFDEMDWDTPAKIAHLNELDARYNGLELVFVNRITSG